MQIVLNGIVITGLLAQEQPGDYRVSGRQVLQISEAVDAEQIKIFTRGNIATDHKFRIARTHKNPAEAEYFLFTHLTDIVTRTGTMTLTFTNPNTGVTEGVVTFAVAAVEMLDATYLGAATDFSYSIKAGKPTYQQ